MKRVLVVGATLLALLALSGCAPKLVRGYEGEPRDISEVAVLVSQQNGDYYLVFTGFMPIENTDTYEFDDTGNAWTGYPRELHLLPGDYIIMTQCTVGMKFAFPTFRVVAVAGTAYNVACGAADGGPDTVEVILNGAVTISEQGIPY